MSEYTTTIDELHVSVDKAGGGTLGRDYEGDWFITVKKGDEFIYRNSRLSTSLPRNHYEVARSAAGFATQAIEYNEWHGKENL